MSQHTFPRPYERPKSNVTNRNIESTKSTEESPRIEWTWFLREQAFSSMRHPTKGCTLRTFYTSHTILMQVGRTSQEESLEGSSIIGSLVSFYGSHFAKFVFFKFLGAFSVLNLTQLRHLGSYCGSYICLDNEVLWAETTAIPRLLGNHILTTDVTLLVDTLVLDSI